MQEAYSVFYSDSNTQAGFAGISAEAGASLSKVS